MKPVQSHKPSLTPARILHLVLMVALLANPVLAAISTSMDCDGQCCCCSDTDNEPTLIIRNKADINSGCCNPAGSIPCQMSTGSLPDAPLALIQTAQTAPFDAIHLLLSSSNATVSDRSHNFSISRIDTGATIPTPPLYLQSCRLIC